MQLGLGGERPDERIQLPREHTVEVGDVHELSALLLLPSRERRR
jgi:hypothetical protein